MKSTLLLAAVLGLGLTAVAATPPPHLAIRGARIFTVSGPVIEKGTIVLKGGLIEAVGDNVSIPAGTTVIDGTGLNVYPGLIDALSTWGNPDATPTPAMAGRPATPAAPSTAPATRIRGPEDRPSTFTWLRAADLVKTYDKKLDTARSAGFTTAVTFPKNGIFAGHGAVINLAAENAGDLVVDANAGLYTTFSSGNFAAFPGSLMGVMAYMRQVQIDAKYYADAKAAYAKDSSLARPAYDRALEGYLDTRRLLLAADTQTHIDRVLRFGAEFKTPYILYGAQEAFRSAELIKKYGVPVILNVKWPVKERDTDPEDVPALRTLELRDKAPTTPIELAKAQVKFAISSDGIDAPKDILKALKKSIDAGLKSADALRALTLSAAEIYGVDAKLGSLDKGKIANLTVVKGDLFDDKSKVEFVVIDGRKYLPAPEAAAPVGRPGAGAPRAMEVQ